MRCSALRLALLSCLLSTPDAHATVLFTGLGDLPGGTFSSAAWDVSDDGSVVVGDGTDASGTQAFRWTAEAGMVGLGRLGVFDSNARSVSADGATVVGYADCFAPPERPCLYQAFRWTSAQGMHPLGTLPGANRLPFSAALGVSADGAVVVGDSTSSLFYEPYRWTAAGGMVGLGFQGGASGVSADGTVVVGSRGGVASEAFRWTPGTGAIGLGFLPGDTGSGANAVSADGSTVVGKSFGGRPTDQEAFRWTEADGMIGLGRLPGTDESEALAVSGDGAVVVGFSSPLNDFFRGEAFVWDPIRGMRSLKEELEDLYGLDLTGWRLQQPTAISSDGLKIVGIGVNPAGDTEAWLAIVPEPDTVLLVVLGLAGLGMLRRRAAD